MKIDRTRPHVIPDAYRAQPARVGSTGTPSQAPVPAADEVTLSSQSRSANALRVQLKSAPEIRLDLVARIKAQVEAGEYNVEPRAVAERILRSRVLDE